MDHTPDVAEGPSSACSSSCPFSRSLCRLLFLFHTLCSLIARLAHSASTSSFPVHCRFILGCLSFVDLSTQSLFRSFHQSDAAAPIRITHSATHVVQTSIDLYIHNIHALETPFGRPIRQRINTMPQVPEPENALSASTTCATTDSDNNIVFGLQSPGDSPQLEKQFAQSFPNHLAIPSAETSCLRGDSDSQEERQPTSSSAHQLPLNIEYNESFFADLGSFLSDPGVTFASSPHSSTALLASSGLSLNESELCSTTDPTATSTLSTLIASRETTAHTSSIASNTSLGAAGQINTRSPQTCPSETMMSPVATTTKPARLTAPTASAITSSPTLAATSKRPPLPSSSQTHQQQDMDSTLHNEINYTLETTYTMVYPSPPLQPIDPDSTIPSLNTEASSPQHSHKAAASSCVESTDSEDQTLSSSSTPQSHPTTSPSDPSPLNSPQDGSAPTKMVSTPLQIHASPSYLKPVPQKSEDWAALVDTPDSPTEFRHTMFLPPPPLTPQFRRPYSNEQFTESPAPEDGSTFGPSSDYIRHVSPNLRPPQVHAQTDPTGVHCHANQHHRNYPYQNHQHHNSSPSVHLANHGKKSLCCF